MLQEHPGICRQVSEEVRARYLDREGYFADAKSSEAPRRLAEAALDLLRLVRQFKGHKKVSAMESYELLSRLLEEQCEIPKGKKPKRVVLKEAPSSSSMQSPFDPDVTYGHKGKGYVPVSYSFHPRTGLSDRTPERPRWRSARMEPMA
jgi:hypothetical protein